MFRYSTVAAIVFAATAAFAQAPQSATATLKNAAGEEVGTATLTARNGSVLIHATFSKLPPGMHALHIHNFEADASGAAKVSTAVSGVTLGDGADSLFHTGGTALVVHGAADDYKTDPTGNAGPRIACGVIEKAK